MLSIIYRAQFLFLILMASATLCGGYHLPKFEVKSSLLITRASSSSIPNIPDLLSDEWYAFKDCQILIPSSKVPRSIIHFIGGFIAGSAVSIAYAELLMSLQKQGHLIVATTIPSIERDHSKVALDTFNNFNECYNTLLTSLVGTELSTVPIIGLSHSLGGKLTALFSSNKKLRRLGPRRIGNIYLAFNNYDMSQSMEVSKQQASRISPDLEQVIDTITDGSKTIQNFLQQGSKILNNINIQNTIDTNPFLQDINYLLTDLNVPKEDITNNIQKIQNIINQSADTFTNTASSSTTTSNPLLTDFNPTPEATWQLIREGYNIQKNVLFKFTDDNIDQSVELDNILRQRGCDVILLEVPGNHLTPNTMSLDSTSIQPSRRGDVKPSFGRYLSMAINKLIEEYEDDKDSGNILSDKRFTLPLQPDNNRSSNKSNNKSGNDFYLP